MTNLLSLCLFVLLVLSFGFSSQSTTVFAQLSSNNNILKNNFASSFQQVVANHITPGRIVYSQACWILALTDFTALLIKVGTEEDADRLMRLTIETIQAVEQKLWSDNDGSYVDIQKNHDLEEPYRMLTQDISLYLVAITEDVIAKQNKKVDKIQELKDIHRDQHIQYDEK